MCVCVCVCVCVHVCVCVCVHVRVCVFPVVILHTLYPYDVVASCGDTIYNNNNKLCAHIG